MPSRNVATRRDSNSSSEYSDDSHRSCSTAPTLYSVRPVLKHHHHPTVTPAYWQDYTQDYHHDVEWNDSFYGHSDARSSVETYASTVASEEDFADDYPSYQEPEYVSQPYASAAIPSTPLEFAEYFPSTRRMCIKHDDTVDGNMNLRIDTEKHTSSGCKVDLTLFHLRMHDLKNRDFSLRRYCRESGREVCHSSRKYTKPVSERRPGLQQSMSNALASLRSKSENKTSTLSNLRRQDSGYDSMSDEDDIDARRSSLSLTPKSNNILLPTNTTNLEFSNYAHVDLKRRGTKSSKRYEFEYWGSTYTWRRVAKKTGKSKDVSYHLYNAETFSPLAHIVPTPMTPSEAQVEEGKGGWIPPCSMWISDERILSGLTDVAE